MSLALAAQHLAAKGRHGDSTLVHMSPGEVAGLHALARAHGTKLTTNPDTGLPEAFSLKSLLPTLAGVGLSMVPGVGPFMAAGLVGGGTALATGSLQKGLMAGLGAYGGAGIGGALSGAGLAASPAAQAGNAAAAELANTNASLAESLGEGANAKDILLARSAQTAGPAMQALNAQTATSPYENLLSGVKGLGSEAGRDSFMQHMGGLGGLAKYGGAALSPVMLSQSGQTNMPPSGGGNPYEYDFNPGYTGPVRTPGGGTRYFDPRFTRRMADGGSTGMTGESDAYYRYLMGLAPASVAAPISTTNATADVVPVAAPQAVTNPLSLYQQSLARLTPAELATHNEYLSADRAGPPGLDPTTANEQAQLNMIDPTTGQPNAIVSALVPLANMLNITSPQQGAVQGLPSLLTGNPLGLIGGAILGNAAQAAQNANIASLMESSMNQPGIALGGQSVQEGMLSGLDVPESAIATPVTSNVADPTAIDPGTNPDAGSPGDDGVGWARGGLSSLAAFARGGYNLGDYSDGGRLLRGPGDGVSDSIPASIADKRPARLADGEFVVPARIVSELGNGSTEAGARQLYAMMDRIQNARKKSVGKGKVAVNSRANKLLPA